MIFIFLDLDYQVDQAKISLDFLEHMPIDELDISSKALFLIWPSQLALFEVRSFISFQILGSDILNLPKTISSSKRPIQNTSKDSLYVPTFCSYCFRKVELSMFRGQKTIELAFSSGRFERKADIVLNDCGEYSNPRTVFLSL